MLGQADPARPGLDQPVAAGRAHGARRGHRRRRRTPSSAPARPPEPTCSSATTPSSARVPCSAPAPASATPSTVGRDARIGERVADPGLRRPRGRRRDRGRRLPGPAGQRPRRVSRCARARTPARTVSRPAVLRRGCHIGGGAQILPGVEIGEGAVVGANAVVVRRRPGRSPGARGARPMIAKPEVLELDLPEVTLSALAWGPADGPLVRRPARLPGHRVDLAPPRPAPRRPRLAGGRAAPAGLRAERRCPRDGSFHVGAVMADAVGAPRAARRRRPRRPGRARLGRDRGQRRSTGTTTRRSRRVVTMAVPPLPGDGRLRRPAGAPAGAVELVHRCSTSCPSCPSARTSGWSASSGGTGRRATTPARTCAHVLEALVAPAHRSAAFGYYRAIIRPWTVPETYRPWLATLNAMPTAPAALPARRGRRLPAGRVRREGRGRPAGPGRGRRRAGRRPLPPGRAARGREPAGRGVPGREHCPARQAAATAPERSHPPPGLRRTWGWRPSPSPRSPSVREV